MIESIEPVLDAQPDGALAELRAYDRGDAVLAAIVRRIAWQIARTEQRATTAEAEVNKLNALVKTLREQRDRVTAEVQQLRDTGEIAKLEARLERQAQELARAITVAKGRAAERDDARSASEKLRVENAELKAQIAARPAASNGPAPKRKPPERVIDVPPVEVSPEETALIEQRAELVAKMAELDAEAKRLGKSRGAQARAQMTAIQQRLATEFGPRLKAFKAARHAELMARQAAALRDEAMKAIDDTAQ